MHVFRIVFAFFAFIVSAGTADAQPKFTFGSEAVATDFTYSEDHKPNPVSSMVQGGEDYTSRSWRHVLEIAHGQSTTQVRFQRNKLGEPRRWYRSENLNRVNMSPSLGGADWDYDTTITSLDIVHNFFTYKQVKILGGVSHVRYRQNLTVTDFSASTLYPSRIETVDKSHLTAGIVGAAYSYQFRRLTLSAEGTLGFGKQYGSHEYHYPEFGTNILGINSYVKKGSTWSRQSAWQLATQMKLTDNLDVVGGYSFRGITTNNGLFLYYSPGYDKISNHRNFGNLAIGFRVRP